MSMLDKLTAVIPWIRGQPRPPGTAGAYVASGDDQLSRRWLAGAMYSSPSRRRPLAVHFCGVEHRYADGSRMVVTTMPTPEPHDQVREWLVEHTIRRRLVETKGSNLDRDEFESIVTQRMNELRTKAWAPLTVSVDGVEHGFTQLALDIETHVAEGRVGDVMVTLVAHGRSLDAVSLDHDEGHAADRRQP